MALKPSIYKMKNGTRDKLGFIAQDIQDLLPELVSTHMDIQAKAPNLDPNNPSKNNKDMLDPATSKLALEYNGLIPVLTRAIQDLKHEQDALKEEVEEQKQQLAALSQSGPASGGPQSSLTLLYALIGILSLGLVVLGLKVNTLSKKLTHAH